MWAVFGRGVVFGVWVWCGFEKVVGFAVFVLWECAVGGVGWSVGGVLCRGVFGCIVRVCGCFVSVVWEGVEFEEGEE